MKRFSLLMLLLSMLVGQLYASRPLVRTYRVEQPDGTSLVVTRHLLGNRFLYFTTTDGEVLLQNPTTRAFCYATMADGQPVCSDLWAHEPQWRGGAERAFLQSEPNRAQRIVQAFANSLPEAETPASRATSTVTGFTPYGESAGGTVPSIGTPLIPVIMVEFPDLTFMETTTTDKVTRWLNDDDYADEEYCAGSVATWLKDQSNGLFAPTFEVVARVQAKNGYAYYGANSAGGRIDLKCSELVSEALQAAADGGVDLSRYVHPETGTVPLVSIYHAGPGEHSSYEDGCEDYLWAHYLRGAFTVNGVTVSSYFVGNETLRAYSMDDQGIITPGASQPDGIGVFIHEFGHALGLPDFYYTGSDTTVVDTLQTPYYWSVMDYGQYMYDGYAPLGYSAYERALLGWQKMVRLTETGFYKLPAPAAENVPADTAYYMYNDENPNEFFVLENRTTGKWFPSFMGSGMLMTYVDYDVTKWRSNSVNNDPTHQRYAVVAADNDIYNVSDSGKFSWALLRTDLWGNGTGQDFTESTSPAAVLSDGSPLSCRLYGITLQADGSISFALNDPALTAISAPQAVSMKTRPTYDAMGRIVPAGSRAPGLYVQPMPDGSYRKVMVR